MARGLCPGQPGWGSEGRPARPEAGASAGLAATPAPPRRRVTLGTRGWRWPRAQRSPSKSQERITKALLRALGGRFQTRDVSTCGTSWTVGGPHGPPLGMAEPDRRPVSHGLQPLTEEGSGSRYCGRITTAVLQSLGRAEIASEGGPGAETSVSWFSSQKTHNLRKAKLGHSWWSSG